MKFLKDKALCFDDVLLVPQHFPGNSRKEIDLSTNVAGINLHIPLIAANMPAVFSPTLAVTLSILGGLAIMDRMRSIEEQRKDLMKFDSIISEMGKNRSTFKIGASIGIGSNAMEDAVRLIVAGANLICIDVAHADQPRTYDLYKEFRKYYPTFPLIVGNFAMVDNRLDEMLSDPYCSLKIGVGSGHVCTTRIETGCGLPTFQSMRYFREYGAPNLIADGGHKSGGDCVKSLAMGAKAIMIGSLFAGTNEAGGNIISHKGSKYKVYRGNASAGTKNASEFVEGEETLIPLKGPVAQIVGRLCDGIRSGMSYCGALNLDQLRINAVFQEITTSGHQESKPHGAI